VEGDYVMIPTFEIASSIDWTLRYARDARWDIVSRALQVLQSSFVKKTNDDAWHTLLAAGVDRNILVYDADAAAGQFTKRLVSLLKTVMRRNGGGNSSSINRGKLTDLYVSPEAIEDIRNWGVDQVDDITRREIYNAEDGSAPLTVFSRLTFKTLMSLVLDKSIRTSTRANLAEAFRLRTLSLLLALTSARTTRLFVRFERTFRYLRMTIFIVSVELVFMAWAEHGFAVLDNRRVILGSL
jgi:hypothetical protein